MGKSAWKIYQIGNGLFIATIPPSNPKWKIEWHLDYEGNYSNSYYDDSIKDTISIRCFKEFKSGQEAAAYIKKVEERKNYFVSDETETYLKV
jgi:hypothetical protein